eukprot:6574864-Heterocapsa_arctica.AAC.1
MADQEEIQFLWFPIIWEAGIIPVPASRQELCSTRGQGLRPELVWLNVTVPSYDPRGAAKGGHLLGNFEP